jgi:PadR family transcriptional regulator, regulatory protein PadR
MALLPFASIAVLHAIADGRRFGFDIIDVTGLRSGTVYPVLEKLEGAGLVTSTWEDAERARRDKRPPRRYFDLTKAGVAALTEGLDRYRNLKPVSLRTRRA